MFESLGMLEVVLRSVSVRDSEAADPADPGLGMPLLSRGRGDAGGAMLEGLPTKRQVALGSRCLCVFLLRYAYAFEAKVEAVAVSL